MQVLARSIASLAVLAALAVAPVVHAQSAAPIDAEKQKLIDRVLAASHPESQVLLMIQRPAADIMEKTGIAMQTSRVPKERADKAMKDIATDVQKYVDTVTPIAKASAEKNLSPSVSPLLAQNFTVDELKQLVAFLESPVRAKFDKLEPQMARAVGTKVEADIGTEINKDINTMQSAVGVKLRAAATAN